MDSASSSRGLPAWLLLPIAFGAPVLANAVWLFFLPRDLPPQTEAWLTGWGVALLDAVLAGTLVLAARRPADKIACLVTVAGVGAASWLALAVLMMAP